MNPETTDLLQVEVLGAESERHVLASDQNGELKLVPHFPVATSRVKSHVENSKRVSILDLAKELPGLDVLDLGCGSEKHDGIGLDGKVPPKLCRDLHAIGANVTGVDIYFPSYDNDRKGRTEKWQFIQLDLRNPKVLDRIPSNSMDVINVNGLIGHEWEMDSSPSLGYAYSSFESEDYKQMEDGIFHQSLRILRPGGILVVNLSNIYQKDSGPLIFSFKRMSGDIKRNRKNFDLQKYKLVDKSFLNPGFTAAHLS